jgi:hypothetical protein
MVLVHACPPKRGRAARGADGYDGPAKQQAAALILHNEKRHESEHGAHRVDSSAVARRHAKQRQGDHFRLRRIRDVDERLLGCDVKANAADRLQDASSLPGRRAGTLAYSDGCTARQKDALRVSPTRQ